MTLNILDATNPTSAPTLLIATVTSYDESRRHGRAGALINHKFVGIDFSMNDLREVLWDEERLRLQITDQPTDNDQPFEMFETQVALKVRRRGNAYYAAAWGFLPQASLAVVAPVLATQANLPDLMTG